MAEIIALYSESFYKGKACALFNQGIQDFIQKNYEKAKISFQEAVRFDGGEPEYKFYTGISSYALGELESARESLKPILNAGRNNAEYLYVYGILMYRMKELKKAENVFLKIIKLDEHHKEAMYYIGKIKIDTEEYEEGVGILKNLLKTDDKRTDILFELGCAYLQMHKYDLSQEAFLENIGLNKGHAASYYYLSKVYLKTGNHDGAVRLLEELRERCPEESELIQKKLKVIEMLKNL